MIGSRTRPITIRIIQTELHNGLRDHSSGALLASSPLIAAKVPNRLFLFCVGVAMTVSSVALVVSAPAPRNSAGVAASGRVRRHHRLSWPPTCRRHTIGGFHGGQHRVLVRPDHLTRSSGTFSSLFICVLSVCSLSVYFGLSAAVEWTS